MNQSTLDVQLLLRQGGKASGSGSYDFSGRDFQDFTVPGPVDFSWSAQSTGEAVRLDFALKADFEAVCVRCLSPFTGRLRVEKSYDILPEELVGEYPEYPTRRDGELDLEEFAYGEVVLEAPVVAVCREDCPGLCPVCGGPKGGCACAPAPGGAVDAEPRDPRWQALRALLEDDAGPPAPAK